MYPHTLLQLPGEVQEVGAIFDAFIDPYVSSVGHPLCFLTHRHECRVTSILTCRFMLSLRQFDSTVASATYSGMGSRVREHMASTVLEFGAQPSDSLPALISSFAHPVHVDESLFEMDPDYIAEDGPEGREIDVDAPV